MNQPIRKLTEEEYLEAIYQARCNAPEMTEDEFWQQFREMKQAREPIAPPAKAARSGAGRRQTIAA